MRVALSATMNKTMSHMVAFFGAALLFAGVTACSAEVDEPLDEPTGQESSALMNGGALNADGDACSITGGPNKGKTGTRDGNYCCTKPNGEGHCQDCTTPSDWCSSGKKVFRPIRFSPTKTYSTLK